jgi:hypothetical protein
MGLLNPIIVVVFETVNDNNCRQRSGQSFELCSCGSDTTLDL